MAPRGRSTLQRRDLKGPGNGGTILTATRLSASLPGLAAAALVLAATAASGASLSLASVGDIFVDAAGLARGENLATKIDEASGKIAGFRVESFGTEVFSSILVDGFRQSEKIQGVGSPSLTLTGSNAIVSLHDNLHSIVKVRALSPTTVTYRLAPDVTASKDTTGVIHLTHKTKGALGHIVAYGAEGPKPRGEMVSLAGRDVVARVVGGSELVFLAEPQELVARAHHAATVRALAQGSLISHYVTEFGGSEVATSVVPYGGDSSARTLAEAGAVRTNLRAPRAPVVAYDLAYETLAARAAQDVAVFVDGERALRADAPADVLAHAADGVASYFALVDASRTRILASAPAGEHGVSISASAKASTERQARAEESHASDARVYGGFEYHSNGKLTGEFLTSIVPDGKATLLSFTALASRTEVFGEIRIDGGAEAHFAAKGPHEMEIETAKGELTLIDDVYATMLLAARSPMQATYTLAAGVEARADGVDVLLLDGPRGPAGALILTGTDASRAGSSLAADSAGAIHARLAAGATLVYRGATDRHASEPEILRAIARGDVSAQVLAGLQEGAAATSATAYDAAVSARALVQGTSILIDHVAETGGGRAFVLDARGAILAAKSATDVIVTVNGQAALATSSAHEALGVADTPRYFAQTSLDGALRVIVNTAAATGETARVSVSSGLQDAARAQARTDAFGAFRLYHDGTAIGSFVTLKANEAAGAVGGLTLLATGQPVFASLAAGASPYATTTGEGASVLRFENREARLEFSDTTSAFARIVALQETRAAFHLAGGLVASARGPNVVEILSNEGDHVGSLVLAGGESAGRLEERTGSEIRAELRKGSEILFRAHAGIETELSSAQRAMINEAMASGRIAGQVIVQTQANAAAVAHDLEATGTSVATTSREAYGKVTSSASASYGDVSLVTTATRERVEVTVASASAIGKTLLVSLDPDTIPDMARGKATIRFDGALIGQASSYADILDASDDDGVAEYFVLAGDAGTQVLVSIPSFSVHTVTLEQPRDHPNSVYLYATIILGLAVVAQSVLLIRRKTTSTVNTRRP